jgi:hypothetical protein
MRGLAAAGLLLAGASAWTQATPKEEWTSIYINGSKVGFSRLFSQPDGQGRRVDGSTTIRAAMLGSRLEMQIDTTSRFSAEGRIVRHEFVMSSGGRTLKVVADFTPRAVTAVSTSGGEVKRKEIPIPEGATVVDDPAATVVEEGGSVTSFLIFDPNTLSLVPATAQDKGKGETAVKGKKVKGRQIDINDPRAPMTLWLAEKGELIVARGPMGMEILPDTKAEAMKITGSADIAEASAIRASKPITGHESSLVLRVKDSPASRFAPGPGQEVRQQGKDVLVTLRPVNPLAAPASYKIGEASGKEEWTKPDLRVPSDQPAFRERAKAIIGPETDPIKAAEKIRLWVYESVGVNAGIGVMRDAREVLETKEGVCRDHAVLMAAFLRSIEIPTQLVSGIVHQSGQFYYHAWVEVWNGKAWLPMDSTRPASRLSTGHVKIASGSVADAFVSFLIDQRVIEVVSP